MCTLIYIAADTAIPLTPWDPALPDFHVRQVDDIERARLRHVTLKPNVYYVGTSEKCGCPFSYGATPGVDDSARELEARAEALTKLRCLVEGALSSGTVELLAFEAEEWGKPGLRRRLDVHNLSDRSFAFTPPEIVEVGQSA